MTEQLAFDVPLPPPPDPVPESRTYWENRGPGVWEPVTVRIRYAVRTEPLPPIPFPHVHIGGPAPRNVLVERADGTADVRPVRLLRARKPRTKEQP